MGILDPESTLNRPPSSRVPRFRHRVPEIWELSLRAVGERAFGRIISCDAFPRYDRPVPRCLLQLAVLIGGIHIGSPCRQGRRELADRPGWRVVVRRLPALHPGCFLPVTIDCDYRLIFRSPVRCAVAEIGFVEQRYRVDHFDLRPQTVAFGLDLHCAADVPGDADGSS